MAKKIRFPLKMNGTDIRTIEELREHFDLESVLGYFANGKLATWLKDRYYDNEAVAVEALSADDEKLAKKLCGILKVSYTDEAAEIDIETVKRKQEKIALLRQFTSDEGMISQIDAIAFNQEDLLDILDTRTEKMIYLYNGEFEIPLTVKDITYVGLGSPVVMLRAYDNVDFASLNLKFIDIHYGWNTSCITSADELYQAEHLYEIGKKEEAKKIFKMLNEAKNPRVVGSKIIQSELKKAEELFSVYDTEKLLPILKELIGYGLAKAKYIMALLYETGFDRVKFPRDDAKRDALLKEAYEAGYLPALYRYYNSTFIRRYCSEITEFVTEKGMTIRELADNGDIFAAIEYARMCRYEKCDYETAMEYFQKSLPFLKYYEIACMYRYGCGVAKNLPTALEYYKKSAEYGYNPAEYDVSNYYYATSGWGIENPSEHFKWVNRAYNHGHINAIGHLAWCYSDSFGTSQDYNKSFQLNKEGMEKGNSQSTGNLGWHYEYGKGTGIDMSLAKKYYRMGADMGCDYSKKQCERLGC